MKRRGTLLLMACALSIVTLACEAQLLPSIIGRFSGPAVIAFLAWWAFATRSADKPGQKVLTLLGLGLSLVADIVFNIQFVYGLATFLAMHLVYTVLFSRRGAWSWRIIPASILYVGVALLVVMQIWPAISTDSILRIAVPVYVAVITLMATLAAAAWLHHRTWRLAYAAIGSLSFFVSDAFIAFNEFVHREPLAGLWILPTYWLAQLLIAASLPTKK